MKVYVLTEADFEKLILKIGQDVRPRVSAQNPANPEHRQLLEEVHRFYNYEVRTWMSDVKADK